MVDTFSAEDEWNPNVVSAIGIDQVPMQTQMQIIELQNNDTRAEIHRPFMRVFLKFQRHQNFREKYANII
jgi:hypothetical protein